jgi:hypothetical protein
MDSRSRRAEVGVLALLVIAIGCSGDEAKPRAKATTSVPKATVAAAKKVTMEVSFDAPTLLAPACDAGGACVYPLSRTTTSVTGSLTGRTVSAGAGTPKKSGGYSGVGFHVFTGRVNGCGSGTVVWTEVITSNDEGNTSGTWTIRKGTGTAGLASVSGNGTFTGKTDPDSSGTVTAKGTVRC